jgi:hypothetical protein
MHPKRIFCSQFKFLLCNFHFQVLLGCKSPPFQKTPCFSYGITSWFNNMPSLISAISILLPLSLFAIDSGNLNILYFRQLRFPCYFPLLISVYGQSPQPNELNEPNNSTNPITQRTQYGYSPRPLAILKTFYSDGERL